MRRAPLYALGVFFAICVLLASFITAYMRPAFDIEFYRREYDKYDVYKTINVHMDDTLRVTSHMIDYLKNKNDDLQVDVAFGYDLKPMFSSNRGNFFSDRAIEHMVDVKALVRLAVWAGRIAAFMGVAVLAFALISREYSIYIGRAMIITLLSVLLIGGAIALCFVLDFDGAFTAFHHIFFNNDLWLLDYDDRLLNIVPAEFFIDLAIRGASVGFAITVLAAAVSRLLMWLRAKGFRPIH